MHIHPISCGFGIGFLIENANGLFLIDTGSPGNHDQVLSKIKELGRNDLKLILITHAHYDHYGNAFTLRELTGARIAAHRLDAESMFQAQSPLGSSRRYGFLFFPIQFILNKINPLPSVNADILLEDGDSLEEYGLDAKVLHTPGHTAGHSSFIFKNGIAFSGDLIGRRFNIHHQNLLATHWHKIPGSIQKLKRENPDFIYTGHSPTPISNEDLNRL